MKFRGRLLFNTCFLKKCVYRPYDQLLKSLQVVQLILDDETTKAFKLVKKTMERLRHKTKNGVIADFDYAPLNEDIITLINLLCIGQGFYKFFFEKKFFFSYDFFF